MAETKEDLSMRIAPVAAPVRRQVVRVLRSAITSGRFEPGQRLVEKDLCELMGVSRPSIREALRQLETQGLVDLVPNRGPSVARLSRQDAESIYQVRAALESMAARQFAESATDGQIETLRSKVEVLRKAYATEDVEAIVSAKQEFYDVLLDGSGNTVVKGILYSLNDRITRLRRVSLSSAKRVKSSMAEIQAVLNAIIRRDGPGAYEASLRHVESATQAALWNSASVAPPASAKRKVKK